MFSEIPVSKYSFRVHFRGSGVRLPLSSSPPFLFLEETVDNPTVGTALSQSAACLCADG